MNSTEVAVPGGWSPVSRSIENPCKTRPGALFLFFAERRLTESECCLYRLQAWIGSA